MTPLYRSFLPASLSLFLSHFIPHSLSLTPSVAPSPSSPSSPSPIPHVCASVARRGGPLRWQTKPIAHSALTKPYLVSGGAAAL